MRLERFFTRLEIVFQWLGEVEDREAGVQQREAQQRSARSASRGRLSHGLGPAEGVAPPPGPGGGPWAQAHAGATGPSPFASQQPWRRSQSQPQQRWQQPQPSQQPPQQPPPLGQQTSQLHPPFYQQAPTAQAQAQAQYQQLHQAQQQQQQAQQQHAQQQQAQHAQQQQSSLPSAARERYRSYRAFSLQSQEAMDLLLRCELELEKLESKTKEVLQQFDSGILTQGQARDALAQVEAKANKLETQDIDGVYTSKLVSGKVQAKSEKREQLARLERLFADLDAAFRQLAAAEAKG